MPKKKRPPQKRRKKGGKKLFGSGIDPAVGKATQIKPGEVRNPGGRPKRRPFAELLLAELEQGDFSELRAIVRKGIAEAKKGKFQFYQDVRETIDGKQPLPIYAADEEPKTPVSEEAHARLAALIERIRARQANERGGSAPNGADRANAKS